MQAEDPNATSERREKEPLVVRRERAARLLGIGLDTLDAHVLPEIRTIRLNRMVLVPVEELRIWIDRRASRIGADWA